MRLFDRIVSFVCAGVLTQIMIAPVNAVSEQIMGDLNGDLKVNVLDLIYIKNIILGLRNADEYMLLRGDLDSDLDITASDMILLTDILLNRKSDTSGENKNPDTYPIDETAILEPKGTVHTGEGTFYGGGYEGGCAMLDPVSRDYWIVAMNLEDYADARLAGAYLEVTGELGTIKMLVTDLLPEGKKGDLDLYTDAFPLIAPVEKGRVPVSWRIIPLDTAETAPVSYRFKEGSSPYWCGVQLLNHRYPISKLEYLDKNGEFVEIKRRPYNYFESQEMGSGPFTFRATDIYGQVIVDYDIPLILDKLIEGKSQFPL